MTLKTQKHISTQKQAIVLQQKTCEFLKCAKTICIALTHFHRLISLNEFQSHCIADFTVIYTHCVLLRVEKHFLIINRCTLLSETEMTAVQLKGSSCFVYTFRACTNVPQEPQFPALVSRHTYRGNTLTALYQARIRGLKKMFLFRKNSFEKRHIFMQVIQHRSVCNFWHFKHQVLDKVILRTFDKVLNHRILKIHIVQAYNKSLTDLTFQLMAYSK